MHGVRLRQRTQGREDRRRDHELQLNRDSAPRWWFAVRCTSSSSHKGWIWTGAPAPQAPPAVAPPAHPSGLVVSLSLGFAPLLKPKRGGLGGWAASGSGPDETVRVEAVQEKSGRGLGRGGEKSGGVTPHSALRTPHHPAPHPRPSVPGHLVAVAFGTGASRKLQVRCRESHGSIATTLFCTPHPDIVLRQVGTHRLWWLLAWKDQGRHRFESCGSMVTLSHLDVALRFAAEFLRTAPRRTTTTDPSFLDILLQFAGGTLIWPGGFWHWSFKEATGQLPGATRSVALCGC